MAIEMKRRKITPIVSVYSTPTWANGNRQAPCLNNISPCARSQYNPYAPLKPADFGRFMRAAATRYNGKQFVTYEGKRTRLPKLSHWEIWNEPNLKSFFRKRNNRSSLATYGAMVRAAYPQIKRANRRAIVIAGATGPRSTTGNGNIGARAWMNGLMRQRKTRFDAYSQHIYPAAAPNRRTKAFPSWSSLPEIFRSIDRKKKGMPVYITEASYTTAKTPFRNVSVTPAPAARLHAPDLPAADRALLEGAGDHVVQPPGQPVLAGRSLPREPQEEAQLRGVPLARAQAAHPVPARAADPLRAAAPAPTNGGGAPPGVCPAAGRR